MHAYLIINPTSGYIAQCDVLVEDDKLWPELFGLGQSISTEVKINNVDSRLTNKISQFSKVGLENHLSQFEMNWII